MSNLKDLMKSYRVEPKGIIHYGGTAEELQEYLDIGFKRILFIQPDPEAYEIIRQKLVDAQKMHVVAVCAELQQQNMYKLLDFPNRPQRLTACRTLPTMLIELGVHPKFFNVTNLERTEIPRVIEDHFDIAAKAGQLTYVGPGPFMNLWQNHAHGRFANEIFQYWFAQRYAKTFGLDLHTAPWAGQALFGITDKHLERQVPAIVEHDQVREKSKFHKQIATEISYEMNFCMEGHYQFHTGPYTLKDKWEFRSLFSPCYSLLVKLSEALFKFCPDSSCLVAIHLRRGDYANYKGHNMFYQTPAEAYLPWLRKVFAEIAANGMKPVLYIATDTAEAAADFKEFDPRVASDLGVAIAETFYPDFWVLSQASYLAISNSSFGFAAAMLNERAKEFMRPMRDGTLVAFDPWNAEVLLHRDEQPEAGTTEDECLKLVDQFLNVLDPLHTGAFIEVGLGTFAWFFTHFAKLGHRCELVEPLPSKELERCIESMAQKPYLAIGVLGRENGEVTIYKGTDPNLNSLVKDWWGVGTETAKVGCMTLDTYLSKQSNPARPSCLKLDVEGAEWDVLHRLPSISPDLYPRVVMFEYGGTPRVDGRGGWTPEAMANTRACLGVLAKCGYSRCFVVENRRPPVELDLQRGFPDDPFAKDADYGNIIAILPL